MALTIYLSIAFLALYLIGLIIRRIIFLRDKGRMEQQGRVGSRGIARVEKFWLICQKYRVDGFLVNYQGKFHAYLNRCRHMTTPLDFVRYQFFTEDGRYLVCMTHGALYEPDSGLCIDGPCKGLSLYPLPVIIDRGEVLIGCPPGSLSFLAE